MLVPAILNRADWRWTPQGVQVELHTSQGVSRVLVPIGRVETLFRQAMSSVGCPLGTSLGAAGTTHGLLASVGAAYDTYVGEYEYDYSLGRAKKRRKKGKRKPFWKGKFFKGLAAGVKKVGQIAKKVVTNPVFRAGFSALATAFPVLAPAAAGLEIATKVIKKIDAGKKALQKIGHGHKASVGDASQQQALVRQVQAATSAMDGIQELKALAQNGDKRAQQLLSNLIAAQAVQDAAQAS